MLFSDQSGTITFEEFKNAFSSNLGPDAIPFNFDSCVRSFHDQVSELTRCNSDWVKLYLGKRDGAHVLGCEAKLNLSLLYLDQ